jgi:TonB-dependent Receptor Plug Domain
VTRAGVLALSLAIGAAWPSAAAGQADTAAARDTTRRDTTRADTATRLLPRVPAAIAPGPLPAGSRYTFTADSFVFTAARTLSDLLAHIPGVYVARGGSYGQAEPVLYGGRGPASLEVYWDGVPYLPLGRDSVYLDPARIPLAPLERVDVVVLPATMQVYLVTTRPESTAPVTLIGVATGDQSFADYRATYATRMRSGFGVSLAVDWPSLDANPGATTSEFRGTDVWLKTEYVRPTGRLGVSAQLLTSTWHRRATPDGRVDEWRQERRDNGLRVFYATRSDGRGFRLVGTVASSVTKRDTAAGDHYLFEGSLEASHTWPRANAVVGVRIGQGVPRAVEARGGWAPVRAVTVAGWVRHSSYFGDRTGNRAYLTGGLSLPLGFSARADVAWMRDVQAPLFETDTVQEATDVSGWVRWELPPRLLIEVGRGRRDPFTPVGFAVGIKPIDHLSPTPRTEFVAAHATVRPLPGLDLSGWYFHPEVGGGDFEPPHHARLSAAFYSKFWRVFRSGIFALRGEVAVESWSRWGFGGQTGSGTQRRLGGASFVETNVEMQLAGATIFWIIRNNNGMRASYVETLGYPKRTQLYGARWFFTN